MTTIAITSQKGGVGKTTVALNLALAFAESGRRTLLVDLDPQGGVGHALGKGDTEVPGLAELLSGALNAEQAVLQTRLPSLSVLPRGRLDPVDTCAYEQALYAEGTLQNILAQVGAYERILLDTPSGLGLPTRAALRVADAALIPFQTEALALRSLGQALRVVEHVRHHENPKLELLGILPTMMDKGSDASQEVLMEIWNGVPAVLETVIPRVEVFADASLNGLPIAYLGGRPSPEARRFELLAQELEARLDAGHDDGGADVRPQRSLF